MGYNLTMGKKKADSQGNYSVYYFQRSDSCKLPEYLSVSSVPTHCLITVRSTVSVKLKSNLGIKRRWCREGSHN